MSLTPDANTARPEEETDMQSGSDYNHSRNLAYLINEVYRSRIMQDVDFGVLISYMPFMNEILPQVYNLRKTDPKEAGNIFFEYLKNVEEKGKYQSFVDALRRARYPLLVAALESNEIISNDHEHNQLINLFLDEIARTVDAEKMSVELQMREVITAEEGEQIRKTARYSGNFSASFELLFKIPHRSIDWYKIFLELLFENGHHKLLKEIDIKFFDKKMESKHETNSEVVVGKENDSGCDVSGALYSAVSVSAAPHPVPQRSSVCPAKDSRPQTETKSISVEFGERVLSELSELKSLVQAQTHCLQTLVDKTDLLVERVNRLEQRNDVRVREYCLEQRNDVRVREY